MKTWPYILGAILAGGIPTAWRGAILMRQHNPRAIFHASITQGADVPMRAELTMTWRKHGQTFETRAHVEQGAKGRYRMEYTFPANTRGRIVFSDGNTQWQMEPGRNLLAATDLIPENEQNERNTEDLLSQNYRIALVSDEETIAGRRAYLLELLPRQEGKSSQKRWIDRETYKTLRIETHYPDGILARMIAYNVTALPAPISPSDFAPPTNPTLQRVTASGASSAFSVLPAPHNADAAVRGLGLRTEGALGFRLMQIASSSVGAAKTAHLLYSDGIETVSVFVQNAVTPALADAPGWHSVIINGRTAFENLDGHLDAIVWTQGKYRFTAVSHLGPKALQAFVSSEINDE